MNNILISGLPGAGKTTLIKRLCIVFKEFNPVGFVKSEITEEGNRTGFEVANLFGDSRVLAHVRLKSKTVVGKYKVDVKGFDDFLVKTFSSGHPARRGGAGSTTQPPPIVVTGL